MGGGEIAGRIDVPEGVTVIEPGAFRGCGHIHVHVSSTVCSWRHGERESPEDVLDISISPDNATFCVENHCLVDRQTREIVVISRSATALPDNITSLTLPRAFLPPFIDVEELVIPEGVRHISRLPFEKMKKLRRLVLPASAVSCRYGFTEGYPFPSISVSPELFLCGNFRGWRTVSKVELIGIGAVDAELFGKIEAKCLEDKTLCVYLNGLNVYPAAQVVREREESVEAEIRKAAEARLERGKQMMADRLEDTTLESLCASALGASGLSYRFRPETNELAVTILGDFRIWYTLTLAGARDELAFVQEVAAAYREALMEFAGSAEQASGAYYDGSWEYRYPGTFNVGSPGLEPAGTGHSVFLGTTAGSLPLGLQALKKLMQAHGNLSRKHGDKMNGIRYYPIRNGSGL